MVGTHDWSESFVPRSAQHGVVLLVCALTIALACVIGRALLMRDLRDGAAVPRAGRERAWRHTLAWSILASQSVILVRRLLPENFDLDRLANMAEGFSGAEIEQSIVAALYKIAALNAPLEQIHIEPALRETNPLSVVMAERIAALRAWAVERCVFADDEETG